MFGGFFAVHCSGQRHTTVFTNPPDSIGNPEGYRIVISYYTPATEQHLHEFQQLIGSYLNLYIDRCAELKDGVAVLSKSKRETLRELNNIVTGALDFYDYQPLKTFKTFSKNVEEKLDAISKLNFSNTQFSAGASDTEAARQMEQFYFQRELDNLKELARMEVGIYARTNVLVKSSTEETFVDAATKEKLTNQYTAYDKDQPLKPIRVEVGEASVALLRFEDTSTLPPSNAATNNTEGDETFASQVLKMLESNNAKLDGMQQQINDLRAEQMRLWQQTQDEKNLGMQNQIDDLREMVMTLAGIKTGEPLASTEGSSLPPVAKGSVKNLPSSISVLFAKNSALLDANSKMILNEVVDILAREPEANIIITGFADRTGDPAKNLVLSQMRAKEVQKFIIQSGLSASRLVTNYFGDRDSDSENGADRKVRIEFISAQ